MKVISMISEEKFGRLTYVEDTLKIDRNLRIGKFKCDCGKVIERPICYVARGTINSCGCLRGVRKINAVSGKKYGMLTFTGSTTSRNNRIYGYFDCSCGTKHKAIFIPSVVKGKQKSCGCLKNNSLGIESSIYSRLQNIRRGMINRCENKNSNGYSQYGGRGIKICDEWLYDAEKFTEWAVHSGYKVGLTIDRIDVNGAYEPSNCRWTTMQEQQRNKRNNIMFTHNGITKCMMSWCEEFGIPHYLAFNRYSRGYNDFGTIFYVGRLNERK